MKRVYVVTDGEYSDYHIEKVFTDPVKARLYQILQCPDDGQVEVYDVDEVAVTIDSRWIRVKYNVEYDYIVKIEVSDAGCNEIIEYKYGNVFYTYAVNLTNKRLYNSVIKCGSDSKMLLKIIRDRFAQRAYELDSSKEELLEEAKQKFNRSFSNEGFCIVTAYTTSITVPQPDPLNIKVNDKLHELIKNDQMLPEDLTELFATAKEENNG